MEDIVAGMFRIAVSAADLGDPVQTSPLHPALAAFDDDVRSLNPITYRYIALPGTVVRQSLTTGEMDEYRGLDRGWTKLYYFYMLPLPQEWVEEEYQGRLRANDLYTCGFNGECELSLDATAVPLEQCMSNCRSVHAKDMLYSVLEYDFSSSGQLTDTDQARLLKGLIGKSYGPYKNRILLNTLVHGTWETIRKAPELASYLSNRYDPYTLFIKDIVELTPLRSQDNYTFFYHEIDSLVDKYDSNAVDRQELAQSVMHLIYTDVPPFSASTATVTSLYFRNLPSLKEFRLGRVS